VSENKPVPVELLQKLRTPFESHQVSKLPKPTRSQTDAVKADYRAGERCKVCGTWHHPDVVHLDYVGHAAVTDRLLDVDPAWDWDYIAKDEYGNPVLDSMGGMWINLTICGVTRRGYGAAEGKKGPDAMKEIIGDGIRNAAMRFGVALELWHKGILHLDIAEEAGPAPDAVRHSIDDKAFERAVKAIHEKKYSANEMREYYALTPDQEVALKEAGL
jgi:hypothetical protein